MPQYLFVPILDRGNGCDLRVHLASGHTNPRHVAQDTYCPYLTTCRLNGRIAKTFRLGDRIDFDVRTMDNGQTVSVTPMVAVWDEKLQGYFLEVQIGRRG